MKDIVNVCMHQLKKTESIIKLSGLFWKGYKVKLNIPASEAVTAKKSCVIDLASDMVYSR